MNRLRPWWRVAIIAVIVLRVALSAASAAGNTPWPAMADPVFHQLAQGDDQPTIVMPLVMAQDDAGFLWAGGQAGLLRWDGYRFAVYADGNRPPDGLLNQYVQALHRAAGGGLWVGTPSELARYDPAHDRFERVPLGAPADAALPVWGIDDDGAGGLWVATSAGLFRLDAGLHVIARQRHDARQPGSLPDDQLQAVLRDRAGALWVGGRHGLARGLAGNGRFVALKLPAPGDAVPEVSHLLQDRSGRIWVATRQHGAYVIAPDGASATPVAFPNSDGTDLAGVEIMTMAEVAVGKIWLGTFGHGIVEVDGATMQARRIRHDAQVPGSLDSDTVYAVFRDRSGLVWVGTTLGVSQYNPGDGGIWTLFGRPGRLSGVLGRDVTSVLVRPDGTMWMGSQADGIQIIDPSGHTRATLNVQRVFCLAAAPSGPVFIGTRSGLYRADANGEHLTRLDIPGRRSIAGVFALHMLDGTLWLGGGDDGLWALRPGEDGKLTILRHDDVPRLTDPTVHRIEPGPGGLLAIGTENGFNLLNITTGAIERIQNDPADPRSVSPGGVVSFLFDRQGRLWVGSDNARISVMSGRDSAGRPRFDRLGVAEGLPNPDVSNMLMDAQGRVWASTDSGLAMIGTQDFAVRALRAIDGVAIPAYWNGAADATPAGDLLFGGIGGLTVVQPAAVGTWDFAPPLAITSVRVGGKPVPAMDDGPVSVPAANSIAVEIASLDFSAPARLRYRYRLRGFDAGWIETDAAHRVAAYTNLPPGRYALDVQGSNRNGIWAAAAALHIAVQPAWFQTVWFRLAESAALGLLVVGVVQARTLILRRRQRELEQQVVQRTAELSARTVELTESQQKLRQLAYFDALTALPNRRAFHDELQAMIAEGPAQPFALMLVDLDGFKKVNDTLGHDAGDDLLVIAAARLRDTVREGDFVSRLGGDEFAILLRPVRDNAVVVSVGDRLVAGMAVPIALRGETVTIGASAGAALFPANGTTQVELYKHVDLALYAAKSAGRGAWRWYLDSMGGGEPTV